MTRKSTRNYSLSVVVSFIAILTLLIALAASAIAQSPEPFLDQPLVPDATAPGGAGFTLTVNGAWFVPASVVNWNGSPRATTFVSSVQLTAAILASDIATASTAAVTVVNPSPGGGVSNTLFFSIAAPEASVSFLPAVTYSSGGSGAYPVDRTIAVADVNGDGKPDIVMTNGGGTVAVLLGNGDGTFKPAVTYNAGEYPAGVAIADLNGDGKPDLVVADESGTVSVLLGNGDGTFKPAVTYDSGGPAAMDVLVADVNGDGKPDLIVAEYLSPEGAGGVGVLLGNGDGTFQPAVTYGACWYPSSLAVADLNGDGKPDIVVAGGANLVGAVSVLLGNGDGTFQAAVNYSTDGVWTQSVAVADVNGDDKPDLVAAICSPAYGCEYSAVAVFLGNGDGTFQPAVTYNSGGSWCVSIVAADLNGDGRPDIVVSNQLNSLDVLLNGDATTTTLASSLNPSVYGQGVLFTAVVSAASGTPTGTVIFYDGSTAIGSATLVSGRAAISISSLAVGSHSITAAYQGVGLFVPSTSAPVNQVVNIAATLTSLTSSQNPAVVTESVTYTAAVASQSGGAVTGTVVFQDGGSTVATVTVVSNQAAYSTKYSSPGTHPITATYSGDTNNTGSVSATLVEQINNGFASKTTLTTSGSPTFAGQPVTFTATVTSTQGTIPNGELVTFYDGTNAIGTGATASGVATFTTSSLTAKMHFIKATYAGDATFEPSAGAVKQVVDKYATTTTLSSSLNPSNYGQAVTLTATVTPIGPYQPTGRVAFKNGSAGLGLGTLNASGVATLTTAKIPLGADTLTATYDGDAFNGESVSVAITQTVSQASLGMVLTSAPNPSTLDKSVRFEATLTSNGGVPTGQSVTFSYNGATLGTAKVNSKGVATFSTKTLPQGLDAVTAAYAGSVDYSSASATIAQLVD